MEEMYEAIKAASKNGKLKMFGTEWTMVLTNAIGELMLRLDSEEERRKVYESGKISAVESLNSGFGSTWIPKLLKDLGIKIAMKISKKDFIMGNVRIWSLFGWGKFNVVKMDDEDALVRVDNSPIAKYVLDKHGKQKHNVCSWILGEISGGYSYLIGKDTDGEETKCIAKGDDHCEFVLKPVKK